MGDCYSKVDRQQADQILSLRESGYSMEAIAEQVGRAVSCVHGVLLRDETYRPVVPPAGDFSSGAAGLCSASVIRSRTALCWIPVIRVISTRLSPRARIARRAAPHR